MITRRPFRTLRRFAKPLPETDKDLVLHDVKTLHEILTNGLNAVKGLSDWATEYELPLGKLLEKIQTNLTKEANEVAQAFKALNATPVTARTRLAFRRYTRKASGADELYNGYVKTDRGDYLVQISDPGSRWGFYLTDGEQSWDGGSGIARSWTPVEPTQVPKRFRYEMDQLLEG